MRRISSVSELLELSRDAGIKSITPRVAYIAKTEEEVALAVKEATAGGLSVTARGGGTGIPSQSIGEGAILIQDRVSAVLGEGFVRCQPGIVKAELNKVLSAAGRWMPIDPSSYASCTVGGMVANNSSGARTAKYGSTIDYVTELRIVHPWGEKEAIRPVPSDVALSSEKRTRKVASLIVENQSAIANERPKVTKNSSGYRLEKVLHDDIVDLPKLFTGSEGTLGVITEMTFSTRDPPRTRLLLVAESTLQDLQETVGALRALAPAALELVDKSVFRKTDSWEKVASYSRSEDPFLIFCELDGEEEELASKIEEAAGAISEFDPLVITGQAEISDAWDTRNQTLNLAQEIRKGAKVAVPGVEDLVVPPRRLGDLIRLLVDQFEKRGLEYILYGHAGDANLHARPILDPTDTRTLEGLMDDCFEAVWKMGGSMTGEHGDGMLRARYVERQYPRTYWIMKELKEVYDPKRILNPGVKVS